MRNIRRHSEGSAAIMRGTLNVILNKCEGSAAVVGEMEAGAPFVD